MKASRTAPAVAHCLHHLGLWLAACFAPVSAPAQVPQAIDMALELPVPEEARPSGCGWFDSSHDLRLGLSVCEHTTVEAIAQELPLAAWLDWHLGGRRPPLAA